MSLLNSDSSLCNDTNLDQRSVLFISELINAVLPSWVIFQTFLNFLYLNLVDICLSWMILLNFVLIEGNFNFFDFQYLGLNMISSASDFTLEFAWLNQTLNNGGEIMSSTLFWERQLWIDENSRTWPGNGENERNIIDITTIQEAIDYINANT